MKTPVFEELDPAGDCECPGCLQWRRTLPHTDAGRPATHRAVLLAAAASTALAGHALPAHAAPHAPGHPDRPGPAGLTGVAALDGGSGAPLSDEPGTPQGPAGPLHGPSGQAAAQLEARADAQTADAADGAGDAAEGAAEETADQPAKATPKEAAADEALPPITRAEIIRRAKTWVTAQVPYSMSKTWTDGYRQDCSGYVSMAWGLPRNEWTGSLHQYGARITKDELQPGDILLFHNPADPQNGSHVVIFGGWTDYTHTSYTAYEQTRPRARKQTTPYAYWTNSSKYVPYRYKGLVTSTGGSDKPAGGTAPSAASTAFPGAAYFGPGANNKHVTQLGEMLVKRGGARFYSVGPGPRWTDSDRRATQAFQQAQGWRGADADGIPGPETWRLLVTGKGKDIPPTAKAASSSSSSSSSSAQKASGKAGAAAVPAFPGRAMFRPGAVNSHVTRLGEQLVKKGFGRFYAVGPGPRWTEADRRAVQAFQQAQGWRGADADGYPGPETWKRLFA